MIVPLNEVKCPRKRGINCKAVADATVRSQPHTQAQTPTHLLQWLCFDAATTTSSTKPFRANILVKF